MESTAAGPNRTGAAIAPDEIAQMLNAVQELSPHTPISTLQLDMERQTYIAEAESVGSVPPPVEGAKATSKGKAKQAVRSEQLTVFMDKLGERIAFERTGTRLYDALITKYLALHNAAPQADGEAALQKLRKIRNDELGHFQMLSECVKQLGGDPTAQTPCADVTAAASAGLMQAITDPRTTLAQCLNTILTAELTDNAGWELLSELAMKAGHADLAEQFSEALKTEAEHLATIRSWLESLLMGNAGSPAV
jgi:rubrerythrin